MTNLFPMIQRKDHRGVLTALQNGANPNQNISGGYTTLILAVRRDDLPMVNLLLDYKADVNAATEMEQTALIEAVTRRNVEVTASLLENGANPDHKNAFGMNPLLTLSATPKRRRDLDVARLLLSHGADPNVLSKTAFTPLMFAAHDGNKHLALLLLEYGALREIGDDTLTAKVLARAAKYTDLAELL